MTGWHFVVDDNVQGPIPGPQLRALLMKGALGADTLLWTSGMTGWRKASETSMLRTASALPSPAQIAPEPVLDQPAPAMAENAGPQSRPEPALSKNPDWFYVSKGKPTGPIPEDKLRRLVSQGAFDLDALAWTEGMPEWQKLLETGQFAPPLAPPPGSGTAPLSPEASLNPGWYYIDGGEPRGPVPEDKLRRLVSQGAFGPDALVWTEGMPEWQKLLETGRFAAPVAPPPAGDCAPLSTVAQDLSVEERPVEELPVPDRAVKDLPAAVNLRVGEVLRQSLKTLWARIGTWILLGLAQLALTLPLTMAAQLLDSISARYIATLVIHVITMLVQAIVVFGAFQTLRGQHFHLGEAIQRVFQRFLPVFAITLLLYLAMVVGLVFFGILFGLFAGFSAHDFDVDRTIAGGFLAAGFIFCGLAFVARTFVAIPSCVVDASPAIVSLKRSFRLTKPHFWKVFALLALAIAPFVLIITAVFSATLLYPSLVRALTSWIMPVVAEFILLPFRFLPLAFISIVAATTYANLQAPSDLPTEKIAEVSD